MSEGAHRLEGRRAVVTGATGGIGLWTALGLARAGAEVLIVGRSRERLDHAAGWIAAESGRPAPAMELADFASLAQVRALAKRLADRLPALDVLVNNAGLIAPRRQLTADLYETTFAVNHLAPFLLTRSVLPLLRAAPAARVVTVASAAHQRGRMAWDDLMSEHGYSAMRAYAQSKLANVLFTAALARRLAGSAVTANCLHPGVVATGFGDVAGPFGLMWKLARPFLISARRGAETSVFLAASPEASGVSGHYFVRRRAVAPSHAARDATAAARLWDVSEALVDA